MKNLCVLSDFDGTITKIDGLYGFIKSYAKGNWQEIENLWEEGKIDSKQCLIQEFKLVPNLSEELITEYIKTVEIDDYFIDFYNSVILQKNIDFFIVSDGIDFFIKKILEKYNLKNLNIISNHGEFINGKFVITFPNDSKNCKNNAGTCKCAIAKSFKEKYSKIIYIGDGVSDFCVANQADILFAKSKLLKYCEDNNIQKTSYRTFKDVSLTLLP